VDIACNVAVDEIGPNWPQTFNDLTARYITDAIGFQVCKPMLLSHALFRYLRRESVCVCMYIWHSNTNDWHTPRDDWTAGKRQRGKEKEKRDDERTEEGGEEGDHVKKSSSFVCQSFYNDTVVVIRIYIHYKASECMTWMYLHFNSERACNLFCTIDLMMWLYIYIYIYIYVLVSLFVHSSWTYVLFFLFVCFIVFCF